VQPSQNNRDHMVKKLEKVMCQVASNQFEDILSKGS
jgi:hypothetical protein